MKTQTIGKALSILGGAFLFSQTAEATVSLQIFDVQTEIVGSTADIPGSGSSANYSGTAALGDFSVFDVRDASNTDFADLVVTYTADTGDVGSNIMIARTTNSQGLTDAGTLSILITVGNPSGGGVGLTFEWYTPGSFVGGVEQLGSTLLTNPINYTTFDIDFRQFVGIPNTGIQQYMLDGNTKLTDTLTVGEILLEDNNANSTFDDPSTGAAFLTSTGTQRHTLTMGKQVASGNALFMFEFRDPSDNLTFNNPTITLVPEPATTATAVGAVIFVIILWHRRRR